MPQDRAIQISFGRMDLGRLALAVVLLCTPASLALAGDDDDSPSFTDKVLTTIGLKNPTAGELGINYSERSPLVVPPSRDLPPPVVNGPPSATNWPKDADIKRRNEAKKDNKPRYQRDYVSDSSRPLRPDELNVPGATPGSSTTGQPAAADTAPKKSLFSGMFQKDEEYATFTGEPTRSSLTDPPPGYLTPSPDQPYGIGPEKKSYKVPTVADRVTPPR
jgi:hypothetical protein